MPPSPPIYQEFMVMPTGAGSLAAALQMGVEVYHTLKAVLARRNFNTTVGDEGGFAPSLPSNTAAIEVILEAVEKAGYLPGKDGHLALDVAASELYSENTYHLARENKKLGSRQMVDYYVNLIKDYPVISIEDGLMRMIGKGGKTSINRPANTAGGYYPCVTNIDRLEKALKPALPTLF